MSASKSLILAIHTLQPRIVRKSNYFKILCMISFNSPGPTGSGVRVLISDISGVLVPSIVNAGNSAMRSSTNTPSNTRPFLKVNTPYNQMKHQNHQIPSVKVNPFLSSS